MKFSKRTDWEQSPNPLAQALADKKKKALPILDLTESNPTRCGFNYLKTDLLTPLQDPAGLGYEPDPHGWPEAREAICRYYADKKIRVAPRQIFLTASTSEAYTFLFRLLAEPGEAIGVPRPSYPLFDYLAGLNDLEKDPYPLVYEKGWRIDRGRFERSIRKNAKAVLFVHPNNPTGNFVQEDERTFLGPFCRSRELAVISDEVFLDFAFDGEKIKKTSFAGGEEALTFTLSGISKILGLPQMKLSWIVVSGPEDLQKEAIRRLEIIADTYLSVNTPVQKGFTAWMGKRDEIWQEILGRVLSNRRYLENAVKDKGPMELLKSEGGWYAMLEVRSDKSDETLALELLEKQNLLVHPGYFFDAEAQTFLVLSLLPVPEFFQEGVDRLLTGVL